MQQPSSANIKHVVVLMFENRSFDHILGAMPGVNGVLKDATTVKPELYNYFNPSNPPDIDNFKQIPFPITPGASEAAYIRGNTDFNHNLDVMFTDLYGPGTTGVINGLPLNNPWPTYPSTNCGFVHVNYQKTGDGEKFPSQDPIMSYFEWETMKVFHALANEFVVCDNWFCDMPGHTAPNRAFMHCATDGDLGLQNQDDVKEPNNRLGPMVNRESIFERLEKYGNTWKMYVPGQYGSGNNVDTDFLNTTVASQEYQPGDHSQTNCTNVPLAQFCKDVQSGELATYSFIMCFDNQNETSMHPNAAVEPGENLLAGIYNKLRSSKHWNDTLLVINFDENGGIYDHLRPPRTVPPAPDQPASQVIVKDKKTGKLSTYTFDFSLLGFRIPSILISPWLKKGIASQQLQNTSILRFLQDRFCPPVSPFDPLQPPISYLTQRDRFASSIQTVFDDFGLDAPRTDCLEQVEPYNTAPYGICTPVELSEEALQVQPKQYMVDLTLEYLLALPGHPDSGQEVDYQFKTIAELIDYAKRRKEAAAVYYRLHS